MGLEVDCAVNVHGALAKLAARRYDLCLNRYAHAADGDGLQVVQAYCTTQYGCSGGGHYRARQYGKCHYRTQAGAFDYLAKPVSARSAACLGEVRVESAQADSADGKALLGHSPHAKGARSH